MKIRIATPMYGGNAKSVYITSTTNLVNELTRAGHTVEQMSLTNESLITRARNTIAHSFLASDCDALCLLTVITDSMRQALSKWCLQVKI
jgi:hypothetical protein